jgi:hypothetical protein
VYEAVTRVIGEHPGFDSLASDKWDSPFWSVLMGFEHERIHLETSSVLFRELPHTLLRKPEQWPHYHPDAFPNDGLRRPQVRGHKPQRMTWCDVLKALVFWRMTTSPRIGEADPLKDPISCIAHRGHWCTVFCMRHRVTRCASSVGHQH